jgi:hypothetical protein
MKILNHLKKHWILYGAGALVGASVLQTQGWVDFSPVFEYAGFAKDQLFKIRDIIIGYGVGAYTIFRTGKAIAYPVIAEYQNTKKMVSDRENIIKEAEMKVNKELAEVNKKQQELDKAKIEELKKQNALLEKISNNKKALPEVLFTLQTSLNNAVDEFKEDTEELEV